MNSWRRLRLFCCSLVPTFWHRIIAMVLKCSGRSNAIDKGMHALSPFSYAQSIGESAPFTNLQGLPRNAKPVIQWDNQDLAFSKIVEEFRRAIRRGSSIDASSFPSQHNREVMLKRVHNIWITRVLERSLYGELLIELGLEQRSDVLENPFRLSVQETDQPATLLPPGTSITEAYDQAEGSLLISGAPGAGKTTLLFSLARTLLERANEQKSEPMPVVFHLSTWSQQQLPLERWLVAELHDRYGIPRP